MQRVGFLLQVRKEKLEEYIHRHNPIWPELAVALKAAGMRNYTLWLDRTNGNEFGYLECDDWKKVCAVLETSDVHARWQETMREFLIIPHSGEQAGQRVRMLECVFTLE